VPGGNTQFEKSAVAAVAFETIGFKEFHKNITEQVMLIGYAATQSHTSLGGAMIA
jgi:hypothetical protein